MNVLRIFRSIAIYLFIVNLTYSILDQWLTHQIDNALKNPSGVSSTLWFYGFSSLLISLMFPVLVICISVYGIKSANSDVVINQSLIQYLRKKVEQLFIEIMRAWGKIMAWGLLFILPGIYKYVIYSLVPFVVLTSNEYESGRVDALKESARIFKKRWLLFIFINLLFYLFIPLLVSQLSDNYRTFSRTPLSAVIVNFLETFILFIGIYWLYKVYITVAQRA